LPPTGFTIITPTWRETRILLEKAGGGHMRGGLSMEQAQTPNLRCSPSMLLI
jgi:hypothetical protein